MKDLMTNITDSDKEFLCNIVVAIAERIAENQRDTLAYNYGDAIAPDIVPGVPVSGFIPFTEGGYRALLPADFSEGELSINQKTLWKEYNRLHENCEEDFMRDSKNSDVSFSEWYEHATEGEKQQFYEYENSYINEGTTYFYEVCAIQERDGTINIVAGLNLDYEYGREKGLVSNHYNKNLRITEELSDNAREKIIDAIREQAMTAIEKM